MKTIHNTPQLKAWLSRDKKRIELAKQEIFRFEDEVFERAVHQVAAHHPSMNEKQIEMRAAFHLLAGGHQGDAGPAPKPEAPEASQEVIVDSLRVDLPRWIRPWAIAILILLGVLAFAALLKAEPEPSGISVVHDAFRGYANPFHLNAGLAAPATGGIVLQLQNAGSTLAIRGGGLVAFNCTGAGLSCSFSGTTFTLNGSGGAGSGCVPPGTTASAILFDAGSGACSDVTKWTTNGTTTITASSTAIFDLSAAATFKVPTSAGCAPTVNAVACYDSTNHLWVFGSNGATVDLCNTQGGVAGQVFESVGGTSCGGYADPIVSGPDAPGAVPTKPPVQIGAFDGTDVQRVLSDTSGRVVVNINTMPSVTISGTVPVSAASLPLPAGASTAAKQPALGTAGSASADVLSIQGVASMTPVKVDGSAVTQPVSVASLPLPAGAAADSSLSTIDTDLKANVTLHSGSAIIGKTGIDQTTPGTTNAVAATNLPTTVDTNSGNKSASTPRVVIATDQPAIAAAGQGATGSAVPSGAQYQAGNGTGNLTGYLNCDNATSYDATTNGATQLAALTSSQKIYVCGFQISTSQTTSVHVALEYGTGSNCATAPTKITPNYPLQAATSTGPVGMVVMTPGYTGLQTIASNELCIVTDAAVSVQALVWWTKF